LLAPSNLALLQKIGKAKLQIKYVKPRKTKLGDCRYNYRSKTGAITLNNNLRGVQLLQVYLHELAHFICFEKYGNAIAPHGKEWKRIFSILLQRQLDELEYTTEDAEKIAEQLKNPKACFHEKQNKIALLQGNCYIENLQAPDVTFVYKNNRYCTVKKMRKRILCRRIDTGKAYSFHPDCIVQLN